MPFTEALDEFLDTDDGLALTALYNADTPVLGIFANEYFPVPGDLVDTESSRPRFGCKAASLPNVVQGDTLQVEGIVYNIAQVQPDGTGWLHLFLVKQ